MGIMLSLIGFLIGILYIVKTRKDDRQAIIIYIGLYIVYLLVLIYLRLESLFNWLGVL